MLVAPVESMLAAFKLTVAVPLAFVNAVAEVGVNATSELVAAKVTTVFGTSAPLVSLSVAVAVTGVPNETTLEERPKVKELRLVVVVLEPVLVPVPVSAPLPHPLRQLRQPKHQNRIRKINGRNGHDNFALVDFAISFSSFIRNG
jgi:hypothetical protein